MTISQIYLIVVVAIPLILLAQSILRMDVAALLIAVMLGLGQYFGLGLLGAENTPADAMKVLSGMGRPAVITLLALFMILRALNETGLTRWMARRLTRLGTGSERRLIGLYAATTALLSLFINNLAAGALMLPSAMETCRREDIKPGKLLIPVAYGSLLGGAATYFSTASIIVSDLLAAANPPQAMLSILDFTPTGGLVAIAGIIFLFLLGPRLLPDRDPPPELMIRRPTSRDLETYYEVEERLWEAVVSPGSVLADKTLGESGIGSELGLAVAGIWRGRQAILAPAPDQVIRAGDILLVVGRQDRVSQLADMGTKIGRETDKNHINNRGVTMVEGLVAPHSHALGHTLCELQFRSHYGFTVVVLAREGRNYRTDVGHLKLQVGDSLLMVGPPHRLGRLHKSPDFLILEPDPRDQPVDWGRAGVTLGLFGAAIVASILGTPVHLAMLTAVVLLVITGMLRMEEAYRAVSWQAIFLVAGMYAVSTSMTQTGLAQMIGEGVVSIATPLGPLGLAGAAYLLSALLSQVMGGQVTALVTGPIMISAALQIGTSPQAVAVATAIGCSTGFLTPLAHPVNILMMSPANYEFKDFFRVGWGLTLVCFLMLLVGLVLFWSL